MDPQQNMEERSASVFPPPTLEGNHDEVPGRSLLVDLSTSSSMPETTDPACTPEKSDRKAGGISPQTSGDALRKSVQQFTSKHSSVESGFELEDDTVVPQMVSAGNDTIAQCSVDTRNGGLQEVVLPSKGVFCTLDNNRLRCLKLDTDGNPQTNADGGYIISEFNVSFPPENSSS